MIDQTHFQIPVISYIGWKVISDNDFKGSFPTYKSPTDNDIQTSTSEFSVQAIWYPDFNLPKD